MYENNLDTVFALSVLCVCVCVCVCTCVGVGGGGGIAATLDCMQLYTGLS